MDEHDLIKEIILLKKFVAYSLKKLDIFNIFVDKHVFCPKCILLIFCIRILYTQQLHALSTG